MTHALCMQLLIYQAGLFIELAYRAAAPAGLQQEELQPIQQACMYHIYCPDMHILSKGSGLQLLSAAHARAPRTSLPHPNCITSKFRVERLTVYLILNPSTLFRLSGVGFEDDEGGGDLQGPPQGCGMCHLAPLSRRSLCIW